MGIHMNETHIAIMSKAECKRYIKLNVRGAALKDLQRNQSTKSKIKHIQYEKLQIQEYLISGELTNREANTIAALRSKCVRGIRSNFKKQYKDSKCPLKCGIEDTQMHLLECPKLVHTAGVGIGQMNGSNVEKKELAKEYTRLTSKRERLLQLEEGTPPGATQDQCTQPGAAVVN
jgi:hypothetical protein